MRRVVLIEIDNTPAEDELYTIGCLLAPEGKLDDEIEDQIAEEYSTFLNQCNLRGENAEDEYFIEYLESLGYERVEPPLKVEITR